MPQVGLQVDSRQIGTITIDPLRISADGGPEYPCLNVQIDLTLQPVEHEHATFSTDPSPTVQHYTLIQITGRLFFEATGRGQIPIADFSSRPLLLFSGSAQGAHIISIPLDHYRVHRLEEQRIGDCVLKFDLTCLFARHPRVERKQQYAERSVESLTSCWVQIEGVRVPQSHWITLLPKLGYGSVQIIEIPTPDTLIPETFTRSVAELRRAQDALARADYDHATGHCRDALERMTHVFPAPVTPGARPPSFRQHIDHLFATIAGSLTQEHRTRIPEIINALWGLMSRADHPRDRGLFSRTDAEALFIFTAATLAYTGRLIEAHSAATAASPPAAP